MRTIAAVVLMLLACGKQEATPPDPTPPETNVDGAWWMYEIGTCDGSMMLEQKPGSSDVSGVFGCGAVSGTVIGVARKGSVSLSLFVTGYSTALVSATLGATQQSMEGTLNGSGFNGATFKAFKKP